MRETRTGAPGGFEASVELLGGKIFQSVPCGDFGIDVADRWPGLDERAADVEGDGSDFHCNVSEI